MSMKPSFSLDTAITMINALPRTHARSGRPWSANINTVAYVACALISAESTPKAIDIVSRAADVAVGTLSYFVRGQNTQGSTWPALREAIRANGLQWVVPPRERWAASATTPAVATAAPPKAVAPVADPGMQPAKRATLAVTPNGAVEIATPPAAATAPPAMVARPVGPCTKDTTVAPRNWRIDPETQDILVTTTTRYAYGSPEHRTKLMQIAHGLGVAAPASAAK